MLDIYRTAEEAASAKTLMNLQSDFNKLFEDFVERFPSDEGKTWGFTANGILRQWTLRDNDD